MAIYFPDPIAFYIGPYAIKWYGLAYVMGISLAWLYGRYWIARGYFPKINGLDWDGAMNRSMMGIVIGGRLGYFLFYSMGTFLENPLEILQIWHPGMSFHGGLIGVMVALAMYARSKSIGLCTLMDVAAISAPIGLFLGRLANFINQEHLGHLTSLPWGVVFPSWPDGPRHPSPLYEACLEGIALFCILFFWMKRHHTTQRPGQLSGLFLMGYGVMRITCEFFRVPDGLFLGITLGQWYSLPGMILGIVLYFRGLKTKKTPV